MRNLKNREARLRRAAARKGLFIRKRKWFYYVGDEYTRIEQYGYCVGVEETGLIPWCGTSNGLFLPTLEEAEKIVADF